MRPLSLFPRFRDGARMCARGSPLWKSMMAAPLAQLHSCHERWIWYRVVGICIYDAIKYPTELSSGFFDIMQAVDAVIQCGHFFYATNAIRIDITSLCSGCNFIYTSRRWFYIGFEIKSIHRSNSRLICLPLAFQYFWHEHANSCKCTQTDEWINRNFM